jgi:hypothetical protein
MDHTIIVRTLLSSDWISWIIHFVIFFIFVRWSGIKWPWALILVLAIEVWETADWSLKDPLHWWTRLDTYLDIVSGGLGIGIAERVKRKRQKINS